MNKKKAIKLIWCIASLCGIICAVIIGYYLIVGIYSFFCLLWWLVSEHPIIAILIAIGIVYIIVKKQIEKTKKQEEDARRARVAANVATRKKALIKKIEGYIYKKNELILIDTNIWMHLAAKYPSRFYDILLEKISSNPYQCIFLLNSQINELVDLKSSVDENKRFLARNALRIIERLQKNNKCHVLSEDAFREVSFSYVDANIMQITKYLIARNVKLLIVTNDIPLRIRLRAIVDHANARKLIRVIDDVDLGSKDPLFGGEV